MRLFIFLHVITMFAAVALSGGSEILFGRIARTRDAAAIRRASEAFGQIAGYIAPTFIVGLAFGLIAVFVHGFNPFAPWLLLAYPLFVAGMLVGALVTGPWVGRVAEAAGAAGDQPSTELDAAVDDPRGRTGQVVFWVLIAAIVFVMVVKPLS